MFFKDLDPVYIAKNEVTITFPHRHGSEWEVEDFKSWWGNIKFSINRNLKPKKMFNDGNITFQATRIKTI